jgi:hypothetical protein
MAEDDDKAELIAELARARAAMSGNVAALREDLNLPKRAKNAFKKSPVPWLGTAAVVGLVVALLPRRTKKVETVRVKKKEPVVEEAGKAGLVLGILKIVFDLVRPALTKWLTGWLADYVANAQGRKS